MNNKLWISTGTSRHDKSWKNVELTWEKLAERLHKPTITKETHAQYGAMSKDKRSKIKDVGGFVGGPINGGRRLTNSVVSRYLITLDVDFAQIDFFDDFCLLFQCEALIYSTHSHSSSDPRFRLIMPLSREVLADEYEAVSRWVAGVCGIELFDPTTFQPERLMYWPSTSSGGEFLVDQQSGPWLDPDKVLARYADWRDTTQWPVSETHRKNQLKDVSKQEDPLAKPGLIGVFCRVYGIAAAIEKFLPDEYVATEHEDRYTYAHGSTHAGAVVYDDKFLFSHHSTDPVSYKLVNAFDLVRLHLHGTLDKNTDEKVPNNKLPSYVAMMDMISKDKPVKRVLLSERVTGAKGDFSDTIIGDESETVKRNGKEKSVRANVGPLQVTAEEPEDMVEGEVETEEGKVEAEQEPEEQLDWTEKLDVDRKGNVLNTIENVVTVLNYDDGLKGALAFNEFSSRITVRRDFPWRKVGMRSNLLTDSDDSSIRNYLEKVYGLTSGPKIADGINIVSRQNSFHPVRSYLKSHVWDGQERLERLLIDYLGADDNVFVREVTKKTFVAGVARAFEPGCKFDYMLLLIGPQGLGKSRLLGKMAGPWFSDTFGNLQNNSAMEQIQGVWIMEIGEMAGLKKQEVEAVKLFLTKSEDMFRPAFGKHVQIFPRQNIFIGTSNDHNPLKDSTGGRRFWPVEIRKSLREGEREFGRLDEALVGQLWAEACKLYAEGEELFLTDQIELMANKVQEQFTEQDERQSVIEDYLNTKVPGNWYDMSPYDRRSFLAGDDIFGKGEFLRDKITVPEIWVEAFGGSLKDMTPFNVKHIRDIMNNRLKDWDKRMITVKGYGNQRGWVKIGAVGKVA